MKNRSNPFRFGGSSLILPALLAAGLALGVVRGAAADLLWKGHTWKVTSGGMAGVCQGDPNNVTVDANDYLHLKISNTGGTWTASEMFTTDTLGFGMYQWQVDGPIDKYDKNIVLGLFPYGPAAGIGADGTNEIDIEYSRWGQANGVNGDWTDYPNSGKTIGELSYNFTLDSTLSTSRMIWSDSSIQDFLIGGLQPVDSTTGLIKTWTYAPQNAATNIPQNPMPLGMNLWCFDAPPSDGQPIEIVIRDFQFVPAGASTGAGGSAGSTGAAGAGGAGGAVGHGGPSGGAGGTVSGGAGGAAGTSGGAGGTGGADGGASSTGAAGATGESGGGGADGGAVGATGASGTSGGTGAGGATTPLSGAAGTVGSASGTGGVTSATGSAGASGGGADHGSSAASSGGCSLGDGPDAGIGGVLLALALTWVCQRRQRA